MSVRGQPLAIFICWRFSASGFGFVSFLLCIRGTEEDGEGGVSDAFSVLIKFDVD